MKKKSITAEEFDRRFDAGEDMSDFVDYSKMKRPGRDAQKVNVDFPRWMVDALDKETARIGVTRQSIIKMWLAERLQHCTG